VNAARRGRGLLLPTSFVLLGLIVLFGLGIWQLERKAWKEALIATLAQRTNAAPVPLPPPEAWPTLTRENSEFTRVRLRIEPGSGDNALVYTSGSTLRDDVKSPGYFVFMPAQVPGGAVIVVNRGYVPTRSAPPLQGSQEIIGSLRWPDESSWFVSERDASGIWYVRDPAAMARVLGWGKVGPFYIEQEAPVPPEGLPHPAPLRVRLRNDHLQYALTWFGLAGSLIAVFAIWAAKRQREWALSELGGN
jgi:cytochrome oxidase assembly protein ShyY1